MTDLKLAQEKIEMFDDLRVKECVSALGMELKKSRDILTAHKKEATSLRLQITGLQLRLVATEGWLAEADADEIKSDIRSLAKQREAVLAEIANGEDECSLIATYLEDWRGAAENYGAEMLVSHPSIMKYMRIRDEMRFALARAATN